MTEATVGESYSDECQEFIHGWKDRACGAAREALTDIFVKAFKEASAVQVGSLQVKTPAFTLQEKSSLRDLISGSIDDRAAFAPHLLRRLGSGGKTGRYRSAHQLGDAQWSRREVRAPILKSHTPRGWPDGASTRVQPEARKPKPAFNTAPSPPAAASSTSGAPTATAPDTSAHNLQ